MSEIDPVAAPAPEAAPASPEPEASGQVLRRIGDVKRLAEARAGSWADPMGAAVVVANAGRFLHKGDRLPGFVKGFCRKHRIAELTIREAKAAIAEARLLGRHLLLPEDAGRLLGTTAYEARRLGLQVYGTDETAYDRRAYKDAERAEKARVRMRKRYAEQAKAAGRYTPRAESAARRRPWEALGISRRTWERRGKPEPGDANSFAVLDRRSPPSKSAKKTASGQQAAPARMTRRSASLRRPATSAGHSSTALAGARSAPRRAPATLVQFVLVSLCEPGTGSEAAPKRRAGRG